MSNVIPFPKRPRDCATCTDALPLLVGSRVRVSVEGLPEGISFGGPVQLALRCACGKPIELSIHMPKSP